MMERKPNDRFNLRELYDTPIKPLTRSCIRFNLRELYDRLQDVPNTTTSPPLDPL